MSDNPNDPGEGHSPAAWTAVIIMIVAFAVGTVFFVLEMPIGVYASVGLLIIGPIVGLILSKAGYGVNGPKYVPKAHS
jgi:hypothetical protein